MNTTSGKLPVKPLRLLLRHVPAAVHTELIAMLATRVLHGGLLRQRLPELAGRRVSIAIKDVAREFVFEIHARGLRRAPQQCWDVRITATLDDFLRLATRQEDPDTLFFHRRLSIEGDTACGLLVKNLLDSLDLDLRAHLSGVVGEPLARPVSGVLALFGLLRDEP